MNTQRCWDTCKDTVNPSRAESKQATSYDTVRVFLWHAQQTRQPVHRDWSPPAHTAPRLPHTPPSIIPPPPAKLAEECGFDLAGMSLLRSLSIETYNITHLGGDFTFSRRASCAWCCPNMPSGSHPCCQKPSCAC